MSVEQQLIFLDSVGDLSCPSKEIIILPDSFPRIVRRSSKRIVVEVIVGFI